jgi:hypothetical protein
MAGTRKAKKMKSNQQPEEAEAREPWNLKVSGELKRRVKVWCIMNKDKPSLLTERLWQEFLNKQAQPAAKNEDDIFTAPHHPRGTKDSVRPIRHA